MEGIYVVSQEQVKSRDVAGNYVDAVRVTFTVDGQGPFSVEEPVTTFSADSVNKLIATYAAHVRGVAQLGQ